MSGLRYAVLDLFGGIGGFALGLEWAGMETVAFCEIGRPQRQILMHYWPAVPVFHDAREVEAITKAVGERGIDVVAGGDPCPIRSRARGDRPTEHADLSGYFLALVGRLRPRWVVRENVPAPDDRDFDAALVHLGYDTAVVRVDAAPFTAQQRIRDFIVGAGEDARASFPGFCNAFEGGAGRTAPPLKTRRVISSLTTHRTRYDPRDSFIWEAAEQRLRILDADERCAFAGFPPGWLTGVSETACAKLYGNAVVPAAAEVIGRAIVRAEHDEETGGN